MTEKINVMIDDDLEYRPTPKGWVRVLTVEKFKKVLSVAHQLGDEFGIISFDNDLGRELEGIDAVKWVIDKGIQAEQFNVHSANTVATESMLSWLNNAHKHGIIDTDNITAHKIGEFV